MLVYVFNFTLFNLFEFSAAILEKGLLSQIWSNLKMSNNPAKYEVLIEEYLRSILDISVKFEQGLPDYRSRWGNLLLINTDMTAAKCECDGA